jgi:acetolactate synthase-1/2/3 large subunit
MFFIMGGPTIDAANSCHEEGIRMIDVRHEQAGAMMAHAYSRLRNIPSVCMAASGPGTTNLTTGLANALVDNAPVVAIGGASELSQIGRRSFQEVDQLAMMRPIVRWAARVYDTKRIPELVETAFREATANGTGPVYLDLPADVLYGEVDEATVWWPEPVDPRTRQPADPALIRRAVDLLAEAKRPVIVSGSGVFWSDATDAYQQWVEQTGIPFFTTPHGRGAIPEDHPQLYPGVRSKAFRETDAIVVLATRLNYMIDYGNPPRFAPDARLIQVDINAGEIGRTRTADVGLVGDAGAVLQQLIEASEGTLTPDLYAPWREELQAADDAKKPKRVAAGENDAVPIHPLRLCKEIQDVLDRDAILVVDGQEILNFGRQSLSTFTPRHRLNSGPLGTMGVGLPFGLGAKLAKPDTQVLVLHGDGSMGLNAMELDTAVRHNIPVVTVVSNNGGWTANNRFKAGRDLGYTRFDLVAKALGCHGEHVETPEEIRPALERAFESGSPAVVNVVTDAAARAATVDFTRYVT